MKRVRGCNIYDINRRVADQIAPILGGPLKPKGRARSFCQVKRGICQNIHFKADGQIENPLCGGKAKRMRFAHKP